MKDEGIYKSRSVSGISDEVWEKSKLVAKQQHFRSISALVEWFLIAAIQNAQSQYEREAKQAQFVEHGTNDVFKLIRTMR